MTTTSFVIPEQTRSAVSITSDRISGLLRQSSNLAQWWVDLTEQLDDLSMRLLGEVDTMWRGLREQLTQDAPHLSAQVRRIDNEQEEIEEELLRVRILVGSAAGESAQLPEVTAAVNDLIDRVSGFDEWTTKLLYDAYENDLGGEAA